jgi:hypothetical protein
VFLQAGLKILCDGGAGKVLIVAFSVALQFLLSDSQITYFVINCGLESGSAGGSQKSY